MPERALLFDVGNTRVKWGVFDSKDISRSGSISHETLSEAGFTSLVTRLPRNVATVFVSNVKGPAFAARLASVVGLHCNVDVHFAHTEKKACGVSNGYRQPRRLGVDRWVAMIGARATSKTALCVVDAGTAVTIDAVDKSGQHLGGQILPGLHMMIDSLSADTSDIGKGTKKFAASEGLAVFATRTERALQEGAVAAVCGAVDRAAKAMRSAGHRPKVVLTGGDASRILARLDGKVLHCPNLVLQGLATMLQSQ